MPMTLDEMAVKPRKTVGLSLDMMAKTPKQAVTAIPSQDAPQSTQTTTLPVALPRPIPQAAMEPAKQFIPVGLDNSKIIRSEPVTADELKLVQEANRREADKKAFEAMSPGGQWLEQNGYPQDFLPLVEGKSNPIAQYQTMDGFEPNQKPDTYDRILEKSYNALPKDDPMRKKFDTYKAVKQKMEDAFVEKNTRKYTGFWNELGRSIVSGSMNVATGLLSRFADASQASIFDPSKIRDIADTIYEKSKDKAFQPGRDGGVGGFIANSVGQALPYMAASVGATVATGNPIAGFGVGFAVEGENAYREAKESGASEEDARMNMLIVGTINGAVESLQASDIIKFAKAGSSSVSGIARAARNKAWKKVLAEGKDLSMNHLQTIIREATEETVQEVSSVSAQERIAPVENPIERIGAATLGGGVAGGFLGVGGSVLHAATKRGPENTQVVNTEKVAPVNQTVTAEAKPVAPVFPADWTVSKNDKGGYTAVGPIKDKKGNVKPGNLVQVFDENWNKLSSYGTYSPPVQKGNINAVSQQEMRRTEGQIIPNRDASVIQPQVGEVSTASPISTKSSSPSSGIGAADSLPHQSLQTFTQDEIDALKKRGFNQANIARMPVEQGRRLLGSTSAPKKDQMYKTTLPPPPVINDTVEKQPWEMTRDEFGKNYYLRGRSGTMPDSGQIEKASTTLSDFENSFVYKYGNQGEFLIYSAKDIPGNPVYGNSGDAKVVGRLKGGDDPHKAIIKQALSEGKSVPAEVLAEYPDLTQKKPSATIPPMTGDKASRDIAPQDNAGGKGEIDLPRGEALSPKQFLGAIDSVSREDILDILQEMNPNGSYTDHLAKLEGDKPLTLEEAKKAITEQLNDLSTIEKQVRYAWLRLPKLPETVKPNLKISPTASGVKGEIDAIINNKTLNFSQKSDALKGLTKSGKITTEEFGKAISSIPEDAIQPEQKTGKRIPALQKILDDYDSGKIETFDDAVSSIRQIENLPADVAKAVLDYDNAVRLDKTEYGQRSNLPEDAQDNLIRTIKSSFNPPATKQGGDITKTPPQKTIGEETPSKVSQDVSTPSTQAENVSKKQGNSDTKPITPEVKGKSIHDYSNTQINLPKKVGDKIVAFGKSIPESEIYTEPKDDYYGRETQPHVTVRYGLETNDSGKLAKAFYGFGPIKAKLGKISIFETDKYDVVKVDVESESLKKANALVGKTESLPGETHKDYKPHATIAYVKKGEGTKYVGETNFEGDSFVIKEIELRDKNDKSHIINLTKPTAKSESDSSTQSYLETRKATIKAVKEGMISADDFKAEFRKFIESEKEIKAELNKKTAPELQKMIYRRGRSKKELVDMIYSAMLESFNISDRGISWSPTQGGSYRASLTKVIESLTDEDIATYSAKHKAEVDKIKNSISNPQTLEDFRTFIQYRGEKALTTEQKARYDEVFAENQKQSRQYQEQQKAVVKKVDVPAELTIVPGRHTKKDIPIWTVKLSDRVERSEFDDLNIKAKRLGGYYSRFGKGFIFENEDNAKKFASLKESDVDISKELEQRKADKTENAADRLEELANNLESSAQESLNRDRQDNTARRSRMANNAEESARNSIRFSKIIRNIAVALKEGNAKHLGGIKSATQIELLESLLQRSKNKIDRELANKGQKWEDFKYRKATPEDIENAEYPYPHIYHEHLKSSLMKLADKKGYAQAVKFAAKYAKPKAGDTVVFVDPEKEVALFKMLKKIHSGEEFGWTWEDSIKNYDRLQRAGIKTLPELRAALREFVQYGADAPKKDAIKEAERQLAGNKNVGIDFFPTPKAVVEDMVSQADIKPGMKVLEPSAGKGDIADGVKDSNPDNEIDVIEISGTLRDILKAKGYNLVGDDFMDIPVTEQYDRILMNPPFSNNKDIQHVRRAYDLLKPGGRIVAIMSEHGFFGNEKEAVDFREWLDDKGTSEKLPEGSFKNGFVSTGVNSRMVVIDKPETSTQKQAVNAVDTNKNIDGLKSEYDKISERITEITNKISEAKKVSGKSKSRKESDKLSKQIKPLQDEVDSLYKDRIALKNKWLDAVKEKHLSGEDGLFKIIAEKEAEKINYPDFRTKSEQELRDPYYLGNAKKAETSFSDSDFAKNEIEKIDNKAIEDVSVDMSTYPYVYLTGSEDTVIERLRGFLLKNRREAYVEKLIAKGNEEVGEDNASGLSRAYRDNYGNKKELDATYDKYISKEKEIIKQKEDQQKSIAEEVKAKQARIANIKYKTVEQIPQWNPSKEPGTKLTEIESVLGRKLNDSEKNDIENDMVGSLKFESRSKNGDYEEDFIWMVSNSKVFTSKVRDMAKEHLFNLYGPIRLTSSKKYSYNPIKDTKQFISVVGTHAAQESTRYALNGYKVQNNGDVTATDGRRLLVVKNGKAMLKGAESGKIYSHKTGAEIEGNFPKYDDIIPKDYEHGPELKREDVQKILNVLDNSIQKPDPDIAVIVSKAEKHEDYVAVRPEYLEEGLISLLKLNSETIEYQHGESKRPIILTGRKSNGDKIAEVIIMPVNPVDERTGGSIVGESLDISVEMKDKYTKQNPTDHRQGGFVALPKQFTGLIDWTGSFLKELLTPTETKFSGYGKSGMKLIYRAKRAYETVQGEKTRANEAMHQVTKGFTVDEMENLPYVINKLSYVPGNNKQRNAAARKLMASPISPRVERAARLFLQITNDQRADYAALGGIAKTGGLAFPQRLSEEGKDLLYQALNVPLDAQGNPNVTALRTNNMIQDMISSGQAGDETKAYRKLKALEEQLYRPKLGYMEEDKFYFSPQWLQMDFNKVVNQDWWEKTYRHVELAREFGVEHTKAYDIIRQIEAQHGKMVKEDVERWWKSLVGIPEQRTKIEALSRKAASAITQYELLKLSPLTSMQNWTQRFLTLMEVSPKNMAKGLVYTYTKAGRQKARASGAIPYDPFEAGIVGSFTTKEGLEFGRTWMQLIGMTETEKGNNYTSALSAMFQFEEDLQTALTMKGEGPVKQLARRIWSLGSQTPTALDRKFTRHGINLKKAMQRGYLTIEELRVAMLRQAVSKNFRQNLFTTPTWYQNSSWARALLQYKPFQYNMLTRIWGLSIGEARRGNFKPLLVALLITTITGELYNLWRKLLLGEDRDEMGIAKRLWDDLSDGGLVGMFPTAMFGKSIAEKLWNMFGGPIGGTLESVGKTVENVSDAPQHTPSHIMEMVKKEIPTVKYLSKFLNKDANADQQDRYKIKDMLPEKDREDWYYYQDLYAAAKEGDGETAKKVLNILKSRGKDKENILSSVNAKRPTGNLSKEKKASWLNTLTPAERKIVVEQDVEHEAIVGRVKQYLLESMSDREISLEIAKKLNQNGSVRKGQEKELRLLIDERKRRKQ